MNEEQAYNDEQWSDLPLPDADKAWQKMERLLDEEDRRRPLLPWWVWRTAGGVLLLALTVGAWLWLRSDNDKHTEAKTGFLKKETGQNNNVYKPSLPADKNQKMVVKPNASVQQTTVLPNADTVANVKTSSQKESAPLHERKKQQEKTVVVDVQGKAKTLNRPQKEISEQRIVNASPSARNATKHEVKKLTDKKHIRLKTRQTHNDFVETGVNRKTQNKQPVSLPFDALTNSGQTQRRVTKHGENNEGASAKTIEQVGELKKKEAVEKLSTEMQSKDSVKASWVEIKNDSANKRDSAQAIAPPLVVQTEKKKSSKKQHAFIFSVGIGLQQSIALHGQPSLIADSLNRKSPFFNYYPSVYLKLQRGKWVVQAEAQYSAPQPVANVSFSQQTTYDPATTTLYTDRYIVQKIYYHQIPFSLSYQVRPQLSVSLGGIYNILAGAVIEEQDVSKNLVTGAEFVGKNKVDIKGYKDSFLYKTTAGVLVQADYQWKRFSLGLRYTQNLQPFIKFTRPDGTVRNEKSNALQAILRFRLFRTKVVRMETD